MDKSKKQNSPLAYQLRPENLDEFFGQEKVINKNSFLYNAISKDEISSIIFWGPPGVGKTTLASIIAEQTNSIFKKLNAVTSGVKDLRKIVETAETSKKEGEKTILFIDEIHRWNKAQQDALLPHMENGTIILIGATTQNPSFSINSPLLSRTKVIVLESLEEEDLIKIVNRALKKINLKANNDSIKLIAKLSNGDARVALNIVESCFKQGAEEIDKDLIKKVIEKASLIYDRDGDEHYNLISAFIKSMRGSDADAALYWLARMLEGGEDPLFIARRIIIFASEDIGLANNSALLLANATFEACHKIGLPECWINLSHATAYMAKSPKSNLSYRAYKEARQDVSDKGNLDVPLHLKNAPTKLMKNLGYGKDYQYPHSENDSEQNYLPKELKGKKYLK